MNQWLKFTFWKNTKFGQFENRYSKLHMLSWCLQGKVTFLEDLIETTRAVKYSMAKAEIVTSILK